MTVERPLRLRVDLTAQALARFRAACDEAKDPSLAQAVEWAARRLGPGPHRDFSAFLAALDLRLTVKRETLLKTALAERDETAQPVVRKRTRVRVETDHALDTLSGRYLVEHDRQRWLVEYEPDPELRDTEQIPLVEPGGIEAFFRREVLPYAPDAWLSGDKPRIGYEISFTRHFYQPVQLRPLAEIEADIWALERETEGLLDAILVEADR